VKRAFRTGAHRPSGTGIAYSREFLEHLARILVDAGHSPKKLAREFRDVCSDARLRSRQLRLQGCYILRVIRRSG
jgi:hypothetical protein